MDTSEILVIEDDEEIRRLLRTTLSAQHYIVREASTVAGGTLLATQQMCDLILLDLGLPDGDGIKVIQKVREKQHTVPILVLSVRSDDRDKILALDAGADDFINKPVSMGVLLARLRAALRRSIQTAGRTTQSIFRTGEIQVDLNKRRVSVADAEVRLTRTEFKLLETLIRHADQVVTHDRLLNDVWGSGYDNELHYVRLYILQLRRKLEANPSRPRYLLTEPGVGYRLVTQYFPDAWAKYR